MIRVVVVAPALAVRTGLRALLSASEMVAVIGEGASLQDVHPLPAETGILILAAEAAGRSALDRELAAGRSPAILLLAAHEAEIAPWFADLPVSGWGVLPLDCTLEELLAAVIALHQGLVVGTPALIEPLFLQIRAPEAFETGSLVEPLTDRENQVLHLLAQGLANKQIALTLGISEHTVKFHVSAIYSKLEATNRTEAVRQGVRRGLITL